MNPRPNRSPLPISKQDAYLTHINRPQEGRTPSSFPCGWVNCGSEFKTEGELVRHFHTHFKDRIYCRWLSSGQDSPKCGAEIGPDEIKGHILNVHRPFKDLPVGHRNVECSWKGCSRKIRKHEGITPNHLNKHHAKYSTRCMWMSKDRDEECKKALDILCWEYHVMSQHIRPEKLWPPLS